MRQRVVDRGRAEDDRFGSRYGFAEVRDFNGKDIETFPSAMGVLTRLACERAVQQGVEGDLLLREAGLKHQQIADFSPVSRSKVRSDSSNLLRRLSRTKVSDFTSLRNSICAWEVCFITCWLRLTLSARLCSGERATARSSMKALV